MTIGIHKEQLIRKLEETCQPSYRDILNELIDQCKELNPWLPIDENTPKDRELLLFYSDKNKVVGAWHKDMGFDVYDDWLCKIITATHYQELSDDPVEDLPEFLKQQAD